MKKWLLILGSVFLSGCLLGGEGTSDQDLANNPFRVDEDCPYIEGATMTEWQNHVTGWLGAEEESPKRVFAYKNSHGLRCYYYDNDADFDPMNLDVLGGSVNGHFGYVYEMEIREFEHVKDFDEFVRLDGGISYCNPEFAEMHNFEVGKLNVIHPNGGFGEKEAAHFECSWSAEKLDNGSVRINTYRTTDIIMDFPHVITLSIQKRLGNYTKNGYPWMNMTDEELVDQQYEILKAIYGTEEFLRMPVDLEIRLLQDLIETSKKPNESV